MESAVRVRSGVTWHSRTASVFLPFRTHITKATGNILYQNKQRCGFNTPYKNQSQDNKLKKNEDGLDNRRL